MMNRETTRTWAAMLAAVLSLSLLLTACGKGGDTPTGDNSTPGTSTPESGNNAGNGQNASGSPEGSSLASGVTVLTEAQAAGISFDDDNFEGDNGTLIAAGAAKSVIKKDHIYIIPSAQYDYYCATFRVISLTDKGDNWACQYEIPKTSEVIEALFPRLSAAGVGSGPNAVLNYDLGTLNYTFQNGTQGSISYGGKAISGSSGDINYGNPYLGSDVPEGTVSSDTGNNISGSLSIENMNLEIEIYRQGMPGRENTWNEINVNFSGDIKMTASTSDYGSFGGRLYSVPLLTTDEGFVMRLLVDVGAGATKCVSRGSGSMTMQARIDVGARIGAGPDDDGIPAFTQSGDVSFNAPGSSFEMNVGGLLIFEYQGVPLYDICFAVFAVQDGTERIDIDDKTGEAYAWNADYHLRKGLLFEGGYNFAMYGINKWQEEVFDRWGNGVIGSGTYSYSNGAAMCTPSGAAVWGGTGPSSDGQIGP